MNLNDFLAGVELPKVKTDVEVKPSASLFALIGGILVGLYLIFKKSKKK